VIVEGLTTPYGLAWVSGTELLVTDEATNAVYLVTGTF
jgi:hypothetical protein